MTEQSHAPLAGITVLEVGVFMAAPFAGMQLADLGARVIKIENPDGGEPTRLSGPFIDGQSSPFMRLNRNKESLALNLKSDSGKAAFKQLAARADVVIENFRPGAMRRLGLGYEDLRADNPSLIYASGSGWGQTGPMATLPGLDIMAQARSGLMSITGFPDMPPAKVGVPICDLTTALYLSLAVTAAIHERGTSGEGQYIDVSLFESGVSYAVWEAGAYFAEGTVGGPNGSAHQNQAPYQAVKSKDGYVTIGANTPRNWESFCRALDLTELPDDERFATGPDRLRNRQQLADIIEQRTETLTTSEVVDLLTETGVPCAPISGYGEVFTDDTLEAREFFWDGDHATVGAVRQIGSPMRFSRTPAVRRAAGPMLGADNRTILGELGYEGEELDELCNTVKG
ncbi:CaiB/BaiF CoA transferase family protein [Spelaeicoccus albus]|uniref:Formyl-CoA transferase n=1 Tax=Spelaeicoccus albus TaxID=1280376 RepID=A0A7Z0D0A5_9MICO|nr:CoA transferase [Spelaeicoccus albus]NYI67151.1 formyl-CoA transferase [Spelaeicoccus albus]